MPRLDSSAGLSRAYDLVVVGAGPAGLAAAITARAGGLSVLLADQADAPGGQIYRGLGTADAARKALLGKDYSAGEALLAGFADCGADYLPRAAVWHIDPDGSAGAKLWLSHGGASRRIEARRVLLATGAMERPLPFDGWTLPGVMFAGAAQTLLKASGIVPVGRVVLAGGGPLLWLLAWQYLRAGLSPALILDTLPAGNPRTALPHLPAFLASNYLVKGLSFYGRVRRAVPVRHAEGLKAEHLAGGGLRLRYVSRGTPMQSDCDSLLIHQGVQPNPNLARAAGCRFAWNEARVAFEPLLDREGRSSQAAVFIAGDGAAIGGAKAAEAAGRISAAAILGDLGRSPPDTGARTRRDLARALRGRHFIDALYRPSSPEAHASPATVICRCESVTLGQIDKVLSDIGAAGPNQLKAYLRCGMGPCQGRVCGSSISQIIAERHGTACEQIGYYGIRPPVVPVAMSEIASLTEDC